MLCRNANLDPGRFYMFRKVHAFVFGDCATITIDVVPFFNTRNLEMLSETFSETVATSFGCG